jgi:hypothetical protein
MSGTPNSSITGASEATRRRVDPGRLARHTAAQPLLMG